MDLCSYFSDVFLNQVKIARLFSHLLLLVFLGWPALAGATVHQTRSIEEFGARGDGKQDNYEAFQRAAAWLCAANRSSLAIPAGTYRIDRYRITHGARRNEISNIRFVGCHDVEITGAAATIVVRGDFFRPADRVEGGLAESYTTGVIPFEMIDCSQFVISGLELDGQVNRMSRDGRVAESVNAGILTTRCHHYRLENLVIHHFATDGITLGANSAKADTDATIRNVELRNNGRQGLSVIQLRGGLFTKCIFRDNGRTGSPYGYHSPGAGVDVEPVRKPPEEDYKTGQLVFEYCKLTNNLGSQFTSQWPNLVESIVVRSSAIEATAPDQEAIGYINAASQAVTENSSFLFRGRHGVLFAPENRSVLASIQSISFRGNKFDLDEGISLYSPDQQVPVSFTGNTVLMRSTHAGNVPIAFKNIDAVEENVFELIRSSAIALPTMISYKRVKRVNRNRYSVDAPGSSKDLVRYDEVGRREGERFE